MGTQSRSINKSSVLLLQLLGYRHKQVQAILGVATKSYYKAAAATNRKWNAVIPQDELELTLPQVNRKQVLDKILTHPKIFTEGYNFSEQDYVYVRLLKECLVNIDDIGSNYSDSLVAAAKARLDVRTNLRTFQSELIGVPKSEYLQFLDALLLEVYVEDFPTLQDYYAGITTVLRFSFNDNEPFTAATIETEREFDL